MKKLVLSMAVLASIAFTSCKDSEKSESEEPMAQEEMAMETTETSAEATMPEEQTIAEIAMANEDFSTLVTAVKAAGLAETLNSAGPYTVFAPTNAAFDKLPEGTVESLVEPANKEKLAGILTYHVLEGEYKAADIVKAIKDNNGSFTVVTVEGESLIAMLDGENVVLTDAAGNESTVVMTDVEASNGVIHAIDAVVMPKS